MPAASGSSRDWAQLSAGSRRRWIAAFGGPRGNAAARAARASRFYESGASLSPEQRGHGGELVAVFAAVPTTTGIAEVTTAGNREASRVGAYLHDVRGLLDAQDVGDFDAAALHFEQRWSHRISTVGEHQLIVDPRVVVALLAEGGPAEEPFYSSTRRRRAV